jgi:hypothetical protein
MAKMQPTKGVPMLPEKQFAIDMVNLYNDQEACVKAISDIDAMPTSGLLVQGIMIEKSIVRDSLLAKIAAIDSQLDQLKAAIILYLQEDLKT